MTSGTREWAGYNANCVDGCSHGCLYCYAREMAGRYGRIAPADWTTMRVRQKELERSIGRYAVGVMFPSTHDITPEVLAPCLAYLRKFVDAGNQVLVVSKPHASCIRELCRRFAGARAQILLRFSITCVSETVAAFWEPGAPSIAERIECLRIAREAGFETSVSMEPLLEADKAAELVETVQEHVSETIWIGMLNQVHRRLAWCRDLPGVVDEAHRVQAGQTPEKVQDVYFSLRMNPKIRWKDSYRKALGLEAQEP